MSPENKKLVYGGLGLLFLMMVALFLVNWMQDNPNTAGSLLLSIVVLVVFIYLSFRALPSNKSTPKNRSKRR
jgi:hypothetical protein